MASGYFGARTSGRNTLLKNQYPQQGWTDLNWKSPCIWFGCLDFYSILELTRLKLWGFLYFNGNALGFLSSLDAKIVPFSRFSGCDNDGHDHCWSDSFHNVDIIIYLFVQKIHSTKKFFKYGEKRSYFLVHFSFLALLTCPADTQRCFNVHLMLYGRYEHKWMLKQLRWVQTASPWKMSWILSAGPLLTYFVTQPIKKFWVASRLASTSPKNKFYFVPRYWARKKVVNG